MNIPYYKNLDGIRGTAALMVMVFHFFSNVKIDTAALAWLIKASVFGQTGVTLFFVLSGFLITRILLSTKDNDDFFKSFYLRRILRIFPLYYLFLLLFYYAYPVIFETDVAPIGEQIVYYTYLQNFAATFNWHINGPSHFWSLAVEEHFYFFWPLLVYFLSSKNLFRAILIIIFFSFAIRIWMLLNGYEVFYFTFTRFDSLAIGALLSILETQNVFTKRNAANFLILIFVVLIPTIVLWTYVKGEANLAVQITKYVVISVVYFALIGYVLSVPGPNLLNSILESAFFSYTGKISYGLYVYHPFAYALGERFLSFNNWSVNLLTGFLLTYAIASASFYLYEVRFLKLKKYFEYSAQ